MPGNNFDQQDIEATLRHAVDKGFGELLPDSTLEVRLVPRQILSFADELVRVCLVSIDGPQHGVLAVVVADRETDYLCGKIIRAMLGPAEAADLNADERQSLIEGSFLELGNRLGAEFSARLPQADAFEMSFPITLNGRDLRLLSSHEFFATLAVTVCSTPLLVYAGLQSVDNPDANTVLPSTSIEELRREILNAGS